MHRMSAAMRSGRVEGAGGSRQHWTNTYFNDSVGIGFTSCTSTAGDRDIAPMAMLQQQATAQGDGHFFSSRDRNTRS